MERLKLIKIILHGTVQGDEVDVKEKNDDYTIFKSRLVAQSRHPREWQKILKDGKILPLLTVKGCYGLFSPVDGNLPLPSW